MQQQSVLVGSGGNHVLGYEDYGDYVILWKDGNSSIVYKTDQNRVMVSQYEKRVDDFAKFCGKIFSVAYEMLMQGLAILPSLVLFLAAQYGAIIDFLGAKFPEFNEIMKFADTMLGLMGISMTDILQKRGVKVYAFAPMGFGEYTKDICSYTELATAAYNDASAI